jgi:Tfp pilus assembly protein PilX
MNRASRQNGAALIVALLFLLIITLISMSNMRTSTLELQMSGSHQLQMEAVERAQSIVDGTIDQTGNFVVIGGAGYTNCTANLPAADCNEQSLTLPSADPFASAVSDGITAKVVRLSPDVIRPPRGLGSSITAFDAATYAVRGNYDETSLGFGRAEVVQGYMMLVPKGVQ